MAWLVWIVLAGVLGLAELHTVTLVLGMLAAAALPAALVAALGASPAAQVAVFAAGSGHCLAAYQAWRRRDRGQPRASRRPPQSRQPRQPRQAPRLVEEQARQAQLSSARFGRRRPGLRRWTRIEQRCTHTPSCRRSRARGER